MRTTELANAKINLFLDIGDLRQDGYHNLTSIMFDTAFHDRIIFSRKETGQTLETHYGPFYFEFAQTDKLNAHQDNPVLELNQWSIVRALQMYLMLCLQYDHEPKLSFNTMSIERSIPAQAGLGGASSDTAAVVRRVIHDDPFLALKLEESLVELGADVPFSYYGGIALATGRGENLESLSYRLSNYPLLLVKPDVSVSTGRAFWLYDTAKLEGRSFAQSDLEGIKRALEAGEIGNLRKVAKNTFVELLEPKSKTLISDIISSFYEMNALYANMTGSGPTCFAFFVDEEQRDRAYDEFKRRHGPDTWFRMTHALN